MVKRRSLALPDDYPAAKAGTYAAFRKALAGSSCPLCALSKGRTTIVVDRGSPSAQVLLVGEAPGAEEDRTGLAFVGRSGRLLDGMLLEAASIPPATSSSPTW